MVSSVEAAFVIGRAAWPTIVLDATSFADHVAPYAGTADASIHHAADLYLACGCARGIPEAIRAFDAVLTGTVTRAIARIETDGAFVDDVTQAIREKLLIGPTPKIAEYAGRASLRSWLATIAVRTALNMRRRKSDTASTTITSALGERVIKGPEIDFVRSQYRDVFEGGLVDALASLTKRDRALLRMNLVERVTLERLAIVYGVARATVARWVTSARDKLLHETRANIERTLGISSSEFESLAAQIRSDVDVSLYRMLEESSVEMTVESNDEERVPPLPRRSSGDR